MCVIVRPILLNSCPIQQIGYGVIILSENMMTVLFYDLCSEIFQIHDIYKSLRLNPWFYASHMLMHGIMTSLSQARVYEKSKVEISFYRTSDGKEIDFILDNGSSLTAIEIKSAKTVTMSDF